MSGGFGIRAPHEDGTPLGIAKMIREGSVHQKLDGILSLVDGRERGRLMDDDSRMLLRESLLDDNESVRISAVLALAAMGMDAMPELSGGLKNPNPRVQSFSAACIYGIFANQRATAPGGFGDDLLEGLVMGLCRLLESHLLTSKALAEGALKEIAWKMPIQFLAGVESFKESKTPTSEMRESLIRLEGIAKRSIRRSAGRYGANC